MAKRNHSLAFPVLKPILQVSFFYLLPSLRKRYLQDALRSTMTGLQVASVDKELSASVAPGALSKVAGFGIRGEVFFAIPCLLRANPFLLGYYRLLLGFSQKEFYNKGPFGRFKHLEEKGLIAARIDREVDQLSNCLVKSAEYLVERLDELSPTAVADLQLLTVGPQLRGGENTRIGREATKEVFNLIKSVAGRSVRETTASTISVQNAAGRMVLIEFLSDPDVRITEKLPTGMRRIVSMEVKGGADASNIHNRLGEAEKSHLKAKDLGFFEFWTILRVDLDTEEAPGISDHKPLLLPGQNQ